MGSLRLDEIDPPRLREWWNAEGFGQPGKRTVSTGRTYLDVLSGVLDYAKELGLVESIPVDEFRKTLKAAGSDAWRSSSVSGVPCSPSTVRAASQARINSWCAAAKDIKRDGVFADYGSIRDSSFARILQGEARREFIAPLEARLEAERRFLSAFTVEPGAEALARLNEADRKRTEALLQAPFPGPCAGCHAQFGW